MTKSRPRRPSGGAEMPLGVSEAEWLWIVDQSDVKPADSWGLWTDHGNAATAFYASAHPGFRPSTWWRGHGFPPCAGAPQFSRRLVEGESELEWLDRHRCLFDGEREAALKSKAKRPARAQAFHEAHWAYVRLEHAKGHLAVV